MPISHLLFKGDRFIVYQSDQLIAFGAQDAALAA